MSSITPILSMRKFAYNLITIKSQDLNAGSLAPDTEHLTTMLFWPVLFSHVLVNPQISFGARLLIMSCLIPLTCDELYST